MHLDGEAGVASMAEAVTAAARDDLTQASLIALAAIQGRSSPGTPPVSRVPSEKTAKRARLGSAGPMAVSRSASAGPSAAARSQSIQPAMGLNRLPLTGSQSIQPAAWAQPQPLIGSLGLPLLPPAGPSVFPPAPPGLDIASTDGGLSEERLINVLSGIEPSA